MVNKVSSEIMHTSDWLPTLYEAAGGNVTDLGDIDGISFWKTLTTSDTPSPRREFLYNIDDIYNSSAIRFDEWKLIQGNTSTSDAGWGIRDGWYGYYDSNQTVEDLIPKILSSEVAASFGKIGFLLKPETIQNFQYSAKVQCNNDIKFDNAEEECNPYEQPCLFNLVDDPCELNNLANQKPELVSQLLGMIKSYNETSRKMIDLSHHPEAAPVNWGYVWTNWKDYV